jgi:UDP-sugar pyrophosphorylase
LDESYPGGLVSYLSKAQRLLKESAEGHNPFDEYTAQVPQGQVLSIYDTSNDDGGLSMAEAEALGWQAASGLAFVLVAGGLGERLGYSGIKLSLETEICTNTCYLEFYTRYIRAVQAKVQASMSPDSAATTFRIPLVIMTSGDTDAPTRQLLLDNAYFGLDESQVTIVTQDKVAALRDGAAGLALSDDDRWSLDTKPHGHGDVHQLLARAGLVEAWERSGQTTHVVFLQDTNALVVNSVIPTLGVSLHLGLHMNSICIPRLAGEAAGAITRLEYVFLSVLLHVAACDCI